MFHNSRARGTDLNQLERLLSLSFEIAPKTTTLPSLCMTPASSVTLVFKSIPWVQKNPSAVHLQARPFYFAPMAMETKHCPYDCPRESPSSRRPPSCCHLSSLSRLTSNDLRPCSPSRWLQGNDDLPARMEQTLSLLPVSSSSCLAVGARADASFHSAFTCTCFFSSSCSFCCLQQPV